MLGAEAAIRFSLHPMSSNEQTAAFESDWSKDCPRKSGLYEFRCMENGDKPEDVPVFRIPFKGLYARMDALDQPVGMWHDGLTGSRWRLKK